MYDFLREYIKSLPEEARKDPEFGFKLQEGIAAGKMQDLKENMIFEIPRELEFFYIFSNGALLGEYSVFSANEVLDFEVSQTL